MRTLVIEIAVARRILLGLVSQFLVYEAFNHVHDDVCMELLNERRLLMIIVAVNKATIYFPK